MLLPQKDFSKYLIDFEIFAMFWFSDKKKNGAKLIFFKTFFVLYLDTIKVHQIVGNYIRNIIAPERFSKIFDRFWDVCHVLIFWQKNAAKLIFFWIFFCFKPRHN